MSAYLQWQETRLREKHENAFVKCSMGVVYSIPFSCGNVYIGITERCLNDRLREHALKVKKNEDKYAHLVSHIAACGCEPRFSDTRILGRSSNLSARLLLEAYYIEKNKDICVSEPSLVLHQQEISFLDARV
uniref:Putative tick transposon n=1 Tax=Rhipicephalus microplus TaxID=6941 RepID=A0A6G5AJK5_RHIMP